MKNSYRIYLTIAILCLFSFIVSAGDNRFVVKKVLDGDTLVLSNDEKVRMIGVDCPELHHATKPVEYFAKEAYEFTKKLVEGKKVRLEYDEDDRDDYNRILAYVYLEDGTFVNAEIIKQGYGFAYTRFPFKYREKFVQYEKEAKEKQRGLWKGGRLAELKWNEKRGIKPYQVYPTSNKLWAIKYGEFVKTRIASGDLIKELEQLRIWVFEYSERDLADVLLKQGWERIGK